MNETSYSDVTVIIPALNEAKIIFQLIDSLQELYPGINIFVSDDGSTDGTQEIVKKYQFENSHIRLFERSKEAVHGLTASVLYAAKSVNTAYVLVMDGDMQHPPEKVGEIVSALKEGAYVVVGIRKKDMSRRGMVRKLMSLVGQSLGAGKLYFRGIHCSDILSGFFGIRTELLKEVMEQGRFELEGYKVLFDILKILPKDTKIKEVPFIFSSRKGGSSKLKKKHVLIFIRSLLR